MMQYHKIKGDYFEQKAMSLLKKITGRKTCTKLFYKNDKELDGLIILNDLVFLVEVKGKKKRVIAGVEDVVKLTKEDFISSIGKAYHQLNRAFDYIQSKDEVEFKDDMGNTKLKIRKDSFKKFCLISICIEVFQNFMILIL